ncbi:malonate decarboxylase holo-ACP synthase [Brevibacillus fluminis]|uniref:Malonate decarboxylase holo-ACP synthase n=1 Tax=Brevibacillus fluminis TaxID=511487 RepID=A0A3M8DQS8_9BACL|nr:malonate decarboxylase holo-ACP synthase [Brevibacillus fluminis]RNB89795.1 malonate decarboxylase holo-ACP synthase [Brevibacillus fluminis]
MGLRPHDLVRLARPDALISHSQQPEWVAPSLGRAPYAVIRRVPLMPGMVPIGVRGEARSERFAAFVDDGNIAEIITPEQLAVQQAWNKRDRTHQIGALQSLPFIARLFADNALPWGPVGSVGFELASGLVTAKATSDLDVVVRVPEPLDWKIAAELYDELGKAPARVDVQLETPLGAIALAEYASPVRPLLLKTVHGPRLTADPWDASV